MKMNRILSIVVLGIVLTVVIIGGCRFLNTCKFNPNEIPVAVVKTTMDGQILYANNAYQKMVGYTLPELKKMTYQQITPEKWHNIENEYVNQALNSDYVVYKKEYTNKKGTSIPISVTGWIIKDKNGKPIGTESFIVDLSK